MNKTNTPAANRSVRRRLGGLLTAAMLMNLPAANVAQAQPMYFTTLAGNGSPIDHTDGVGSNARLMNATGAAVDGAGNIYIADGGDHTIRKVTPGGSVSTLAGGSGLAGSNDGANSDARFLYPFAIAVDATGSTVYVADSGNHNVRKITSSGVTTIAGTTGIAGRTDGIGTAAQFNAPQGIAVDAAGVVYVSDTNNSTIRKIFQNGTVTTLAGVAGETGAADGAGTSARFNYPCGVAVDSASNVYVADFGNSVIRRITPDGTVTTFAGTAMQTGNVDGQGGAARFDHPMDVSADISGNVYVADTTNQTIRLISPTGSVSTRAGKPGVGGRADGAGAAARFFYPYGIAANSTGTVYVADTGNHTLRNMSPSGEVGTLAGTTGQTGSTDGTGSAATFAYPDGIALDGAGNLFVADHNNHVIRKITAGGTVTTFAGTAGLAGFADGPGGAARFNEPTGVAVDGGGSVYVADAGNSTIRKITAGGVVTTFAGSPGNGGSGDGVGTGARFNAPQGVAVDSAGNVYVADTNNSTIRKVTSNGTVTTLAGAAGQTGSGDGPGGGARFSSPYAVAVDSAGNVYVADFKNATIRKIAVSTGAVTTLAGAAGQLGYTDAAGNLARFNQPYGVAADNNGNVYVADTYNRAIRKVTASGGVATVNGTAARFYYPQGIAVDGAGNIYVADGDNQAIGKGGVLPPPPSGSPVAGSTVTAGQNATFSLGAAVAGTAYQWQVSTDAGATWTSVGNTAAYSGATTVTLTITAVTQAMNGYLYRVQQTNASGSGTSGSGALTVSAIVVIPPSGPSGGSRISNMSVRTNLAGGQGLTVGFVTSGAKNLLIRAVGPTLQTIFGLTNYYSDPKFSVVSGGVTIDANDNWAASLSAIFASVGAFALDPNSKDAALVRSVNGPNTAEVGGAGSGIMLVELYDTDAPTAAARLTNVSARNQVGTGGDILVSGFVIAGTGSLTLLIRGIGPALHDVFGVNGQLADPLLEIHQTINGVDTVIAANDNWAASLTATFDQVGAYHFTAGSKDAALLITLQPGVYTAQVSGVGSGTGDGVVEVYEVP